VLGLASRHFEAALSAGVTKGGNMRERAAENEKKEKEKE